jgi:hypothetical protein
MLTRTASIVQDNAWFRVRDCQVNAVVGLLQGQSSNALHSQSFLTTMSCRFVDDYDSIRVFYQNETSD